MLILVEPSLLNVSFDVPGYDVVRTDFNGRGGGTAILIRKDLKYREVRVLVVESFCDVTGIQLYNDRITCSVFSVYVPNDVRVVQSDCLNSLFTMS